jgi:glycosyltransferase involved in cell wall biosynthesis
LEYIRRRHLAHSILCRDLGGWFDHVWSVNPLVGADPVEVSAMVRGRPVTTELAPGHTIVEGHVSLSPRLASVAPLDFLLAQVPLVRSLLGLVRSRKVTVIRAGDPYYLGLLGLLLGRIGRVPVVVRISGNYDAVYARTGRPAFPRLFRSRRVEKIIERFVLRRADFVTAGNRDNLDFAIANGAVAEQTAVFPYGNLVDPLHFLPPGGRGGRPIDLPKSRFLIAVTRLEPVKRTDEVVRAWAAVRDEHPDVDLVLVGDGSQRAELHALAADLGVCEGLHLIGNRDQMWISRALPESVAIVAASAGRALVEAGLSGRPVVAYDEDWHGELVRDGVTGILVPAGDVGAMTDGLCRLLSDDALAGRFGDAIRAETIERMDQERLNAAERAIYEGLMS